MQVDRDLVPAKRGGRYRQVVSEAYDPGFAVFPEECGGWILTIEAPNGGSREGRMERLQAGLSRHVIRKVGRRELSPARMRRSISFPCTEIRKLGRLRI